MTVNLPAEPTPAGVSRLDDAGIAGDAEFVGRTGEVELLSSLLAPVERPATNTVVVCGMGGIGKTALVRHAAELAVREGWFSGGALFVKLRGYDPEQGPVVVSQVFRSLLYLLGVPPDSIPETPTDQATAYHEWLRTLAYEKRPVLLVLDDASASSQVQDLLPRQSIHRTLVTTRESWSLPATHELDLDVLTDADALELLRSSLRTRRQNDPRLTLDHQAGHELADLCGYLPLAVEIAAAILADEPDLSLRELSDDLADAESRLDTLRHADKKVITVVDVSWHRLRGRDAEAANLLPLLTVNPGSDLATDAVGALANRSATRVKPPLRALRDAHLLQRTNNGRWQLHDLVDLYGARRLDQQSTEYREAATTRLLDHYGRLATREEEHLRPRTQDEYPDWRAAATTLAINRFDDEYVNLMNSIILAVRVDRADIALQLVEGIGRFLAFRHRHEEWSVVLDFVLSKVDQSSLERQRLGQLLMSLGRANWASGYYPEALDATGQAIEIFRTGDDQHSLAMALTARGNIFERRGKYDDARASFDEAANILQAIGHWQHACTAWEGVAIQLVHASRFEEAVDAFREAYECRTRVADGKGQGLNFVFLISRVSRAYAHPRGGIDVLTKLSSVAAQRYGVAMTNNILGFYMPAAE